jgi:hypothetical protein
LLLIVVSSSCSDKKDASYDGSGIELSFLDGEVMKGVDTDFLVADFIAIHNSRLYTKSITKDTLVRVYLVKGDSLILAKRFLLNGEGPYEVLNVFTGIYNKEKSQLTFLENAGKLMRGYIIDEDSIDVKSSWRKLDFSHIANFRAGHSFTYISDSLLLCIGGTYNTSSILSIINLNDIDSINSLQFWPEDNFDANVLVKQCVYMDNAKIYKNKTLNKYLYICGMGKYMEIFKLEGYNIIDRIEICKGFPKYKIKNDNINYSQDENDMNQGFSTYATDNFIYVKPMEFTVSMLRSRANYKGYPCYYNDKIDVFDWDGNIVKRFELDTPFSSFVVDEENKVIYVDTDDLDNGDTLIKRYKYD